MDELSRIVQEMLGRTEGPFSLRFLLQPLMASIFAVRDGLKDARSGKPPFLWTAITDPSQRSELLKSGWKSVGKIFIVAVVLDLIYQIVVFHALRPVQGILVPVVLALVPYIVLRGPVNRLSRRRRPSP